MAARAATGLPVRIMTRRMSDGKRSGSHQPPGAVQGWGWSCTAGSGGGVGRLEGLINMLWSVIIGQRHGLGYIGDLYDRLLFFLIPTFFCISLRGGGGYSLHTAQRSCTGIKGKLSDDVGQPGIRAGDTRVSHTHPSGSCGTPWYHQLVFRVFPYLNLVFLLLYAKNYA